MQIVGEKALRGAGKQWSACGIFFSQSRPRGNSQANNYFEISVRAYVRQIMKRQKGKFSWEYEVLCRENKTYKLKR